MAEAFVEIGVEIVGDKEIIVEELDRGFVDHEFLVEAVSMACLIVGLSDILDSH